MPLQQVISVLDNRILYLENQFVKISGEPQLVNTDNLNNQDVNNEFNKEKIEDMIINTIKNHMAEFDHRYELLANEIVNLKQIVLQLQSYTLDVNKTLLGDRDHLLELINQSNAQPNQCISANIAQEAKDAEEASVDETTQDAKEAIVVEKPKTPKKHQLSRKPKTPKKHQLSRKPKTPKKHQLSKQPKTQKKHYLQRNHKRYQKRHK